MNRNAISHVIRVMGSMSGASLSRRSWSGIAGAGLLIVSGSIHLDLYLTGYRSIPTIGWLFLLQVISAYLLAVVIPLSRQPLAAAAGAGFGLATLGGYLLSLKVGLFGFTEVRTTAGIIAAVATPKAAPVAAGGQALTARQIGGVSVLTNAQGLTLYSFAPDSPTKSACYGSCAAYWPPVPGNVSAGSGVTGKIGTIKRAGGSTQATYDGHPLYTYIGDHGPGQDSGNKINLNDGLWLDVPVSG